MLQSRQIEAFRAVMLAGGMTAGAAMMRVTQPAVSRLIRDLEGELGFALFERRGNALTPTFQARALLLEVERSFVGLDRITTFARGLRTGQGGTLRMAALPAMAAFLPRFAARFSRAHPDLDIYVDSLPSTMIRDLVASGQLDLGVSVVPFKTPGLVSTMLDDHAVVVMPEGHRLAGKRAIEAGDLAGTDVVMLSKFAHDMRHPVELALQGVVRSTVLETQLGSIACVLVQEGAGIAIVDPFSASEFVGQGLVVRPLRPPMVVGIAVVHSSERVLSPAAELFHAAFMEHATAFLQAQDAAGAGPGEVGA